MLNFTFSTNAKTTHIFKAAEELNLLKKAGEDNCPGIGDYQTSELFLLHGPNKLYPMCI